MTSTFSLDDIRQLSRIPRMNLINSISGFKSANLIGTQDTNGIGNLAIFSSAVHLGADPPLMGFVFRPIEQDMKTTRHTYFNIKNTGFFTLNYVNPSIIEAAHQSSASYPDGISEFDALGLTPHFSESIRAPYVAESLVKVGLSYVEEYFIEANRTIFMVARIEEIHVADGILDENLNFDMQAAQAVAVTGLDTYHSAAQIARLPYARVPK